MLGLTEKALAKVTAGKECVDRMHASFAKVCGPARWDHPFILNPDEWDHPI